MTSNDERLPEKKRGHWTRLKDGEHLLLEQQPDVVYEWLKKVLDESSTDLAK